MSPGSDVTLLSIYIGLNVSSSAHNCGYVVMAVTLWQQFEYYCYYICIYMDEKINEQKYKPNHPHSLSRLVPQTPIRTHAKRSGNIVYELL